MKVEDNPDVFQSIEAKLSVAIKKDSVQSLHSIKNKKFNKCLKSNLGNIKWSLLDAALTTFRGHDFEDLADFFDRNLKLVLGVVYPTCSHSGHLLDIINDVFGVRDT